MRLALKLALKLLVRHGARGTSAQTSVFQSQDIRVGLSMPHVSLARMGCSSLLPTSLCPGSDASLSIRILRLSDGAGYKRPVLGCENCWKPFEILFILRTVWAPQAQSQSAFLGLPHLLVRTLGPQSVQVSAGQCSDLCHPRNWGWRWSTGAGVFGVEHGLLCPVWGLSAYIGVTQTGASSLSR